MRINSLTQNRIYPINNLFRPAFGRKSKKENNENAEHNTSLAGFIPAYFACNPPNDKAKVYDGNLGNLRKGQGFIRQNLEDVLICGEGGEAYTFNILGADNYVLRVPKACRARLMQEDFASPDIIPVLYDEKLFNSRNLGLPLYVIKDSAEGDKKTCSIFYFPYEMPCDSGLVTILRKVPGDTVMYSYKDALKKFTGVDKYYDYEREQLFGSFLDTIRNLKNMPDDFTGCGELMEDEEFARDYRDFADKYIGRLEEIADMPKEAYDKALRLIHEADGYIFDFKNPDNILIDTDKQEFNFVDLQFNFSNFCYYECDDVNEAFRNALLGGEQFYMYMFDFPGELLADASDFDKFLRLKTIISKKCGVEDGFDFS